MVARWAHNPKVVSSNLAPATKSRDKRLFLFNPVSIMYFVYILYSLRDHKLYKGFTSNIQNRLLKHNSGGSKSTSHRKPFVIVYIELFENKSEALKREKYFKSIEGGTALKQQLVDSSILREDGKLNMKPK